MTKKLTIWTFATLTVFFVFSCSTKYIVNQDGGLRPKKASFFKYRGDYKYSPIDNIDTNAIYVSHQGTIWFGDKDSIRDAVVFYRFYSSGHLYISPAYDSIPPLEQINNIKSGNVGYYKVVEGQIKIEYLYYVDGGSRKTASGKLENDKLITRDRGDKTVWVKTKINGLRQVKPDW